MKGCILVILLLSTGYLQSAVVQDNPSTIDKVLSFPSPLTDHIDKKRVNEETPPPQPTPKVEPKTSS